MEIGYNIRDIMTQGQSVQEQIYFFGNFAGFVGDGARIFGLG